MNNFICSLALISTSLALGFVACSTPDNTLQRPPDVSLVKASLDSLAALDGYSGVALLATSDSMLLAEAYGIADEDTREPITLDTRFSLASTGKMFTSVAILRLRDAGKLQLDQTVGEFLPDYPLTAVRDSVTVRHLLTHTSGLGDYLDDRMEALDPADIQTVSDYQALFENDPLRFAPGTDFSYSNAGYVVLGRILEAITGQPFDEHLQQTLFEPLGMSATGWVSDEASTQGMAKGYGFRDSTGAWVENPYLRPAEGKLAMGPSPAGGGYSTAGDLLRFARALNDGEIASPTTLTEMIDTTGGRKYGFGVSLRNLNGHRVYGHNGGFPGVATEVDILPDAGYYIVTLSNRDPRDGWVHARGILRKALVGEAADARATANAEALVATLASAGLDAARAQLDSLQGNVDEKQLMNTIGNSMNEGDTDKALALTELTLVAFPESWFAHSVRADVYAKLGREAEAIAGWQQSLAYNPDNQWAKDRLAERGVE